MEQGLIAVTSGVALDPLWYPKYWLGLSTVASWPYYSWDDGVSPGPDYPSNSKYYRHWGNFQNTAAEPNEAALCAVADYMEAYNISKANQSPPSLSDSYAAWGWNDQHCNRTFAYICQYPPSREWRLPPRLPPHPSLPLRSWRWHVLISTSGSVTAGDLAGHQLTVPASEEEQYEVEQFYISNGYIFPFMAPASYWIGYSLNQTSGNWTGLDLLQPTIDDYNAWGM